MSVPPHHPVPAGVLDGDICAIARKGAGKSYMMRGLVERLLVATRRVVILDPMNIWWGLKARADGTPGFAVVVFGGPNADLPLDPAGGTALGAYLATADISAVVDVSALSREEMVRFSADFLSALYHINRRALWLVLEEADTFAPQNPMKDCALLSHAVDQIARRGRGRGFRLWTLTQRPARLNKDVLSMAAALAVLQVRGPQDRGAVEDWVRGNADVEAARVVIDSLAGLPVGEGWIWAPDLELLERVKFPENATLDTSYTPAPDEPPRSEPGELAKVDIAQIARALAVPEPEPAAKPFDDGLRMGRAQGRSEERRAMQVALQRLLDDWRDEEVLEAEPEPAPPAEAPMTDDRFQRDTLNGLQGLARRLLEHVLEQHPKPVRIRSAARMFCLEHTDLVLNVAIMELKEAKLIEFSDAANIHAAPVLFPSSAERTTA